MISVSIVVPAYNKELYVEHSMRSLMDQTFIDYELIIIEDCSTDSTYEILTKLAAEDHRIRLYRNAQNMGAAFSRNRGLDLASGKYVMFLDSDDYYYPDMLEILYDIAEREGTDIVYPGYRMIQMSEDGLSFDESKEVIEKKHIYKCIEPLKETVSFFDNAQTNVLRFYRREFLIENGLRFQTLPNSNDVFFAYVTTTMAQKIVWSDAILVDYYTNTPTSLQKAKTGEYYGFEAYAAVWDWLSGHDAPPKIKIWCIERTLKFIMHDLFEIKPDFDKCKANLEKLRHTNGFDHLVRLAEEGRFSSEYQRLIEAILDASDPGDLLGRNPYFYMCDKISELFNAAGRDGTRLCLWGCGKYGKSLLDYVSINTDYRFSHVVDSSPMKLNTMYDGYLIEDYDSICDDVDILVFTNYRVCEEVSKSVKDKKTVVLK